MLQNPLDVHKRGGEGITHSPPGWTETVSKQEQQHHHFWISCLKHTDAWCTQACFSYVCWGNTGGNFAQWHPMQRLSKEERKLQEEAAKVAGAEQFLAKGFLDDGCCQQNCRDHRMSSHFLFIFFTAIPRCRFCSTFHPDCKCVFGVCLMIMWHVRKTYLLKKSIKTLRPWLKCQPVKLHRETHKWTCTDRNTMESINQNDLNRWVPKIILATLWDEQREIGSFQ